MTVRRKYFQCAWVVDDVESAVHRWVDQAAIAPFFVFPHMQIQNGVYRGDPTTPDVSVAIAQVGDMQIELIEQHDGLPSPYSERAPGVPPGSQHHIAALTDDLDANIAYYRGINVDIVFSGTFGGGRFAYFDTNPTIGCLTELVERDPAVESLFALVRTAGAEWDGTDPMRSLSGA